MKRISDKGFTLVIVLILLGISSVVVLSSLRENMVQERLSGNFQKKINSRLLAEKGVFEQAQAMQQKLNDDSSLDMIQMVADSGVITGTGEVSDSKFSSSVAINAAGEIEITSQGSRYDDDAQSNLVARYGFVPASPGSLFTNALVGCVGLNLRGSGVIDSYDSDLGTYDETNTSEGDVATIDEDADVSVGGDSIRGDIKATGIVYLQSDGIILGDIHSNGGVEISGGRDTSTLRVEGNVRTQGDFSYQRGGGHITGYVRVNGDVSMAQGTFIDNINAEGLDILYGGSGSFGDSAHAQGGSAYTAVQFNINPEVEAVSTSDPTLPGYDPTNPDTSCDPINIPARVINLIDDTTSYTNFALGGGAVYAFEPKQGQSISGSFSDLTATTDEVFIFSGLPQIPADAAPSEYIFGFTGVKLSSNAAVTIDGGDVIWVVDGQFDMQNNSKLTVKAGSSLTIITTGKFNIGASAKVIVEDQGLAPSGHPAFQVFSSFVGNDGILIQSDSQLYAAIYAPLTSVKLTGSGALFGTVRGASVNANGGSGIHFDSALLNANNSPGGNLKPKIVFLGWYYKVPEDEPII